MQSSMMRSSTTTATIRSHLGRPTMLIALPAVQSALVPLRQTAHQQLPAGPRQSVLVQVSAGKGFGPAKPVKRAPQTQPNLELCPCDSKKAYKNCCQKMHDGEAASTPEATLRARFSAFPKGNLEYLVQTTHRDYYPYHYNKPEAEEQLRADYTAGINKFAYAGLKITGTEQGSHEDEGFVTFEYLSTKRDEADKPANSWDRTNEKARFLRVNGLWQFVDYQRYSYNASELTAAAAAPASA